MADTLGSLVDKLSIVNLKLWHVQDWVHEVEKKSYETNQFTPSEMVENIRRLAVLNKQRNALMSEIDGLLDQAIRTGVVGVEERIKL
jgi:hypothetical protein